MSSPFGDDFKEDDLDKLDEDKLASEGSPSGSSAMKKADADEADARPRSSVFGAGVTTSRPGGGGLPGSTSSGISAPSPIRGGSSVQPYNRQPLSGAVTPAGGAKAPESSALSTSASTPPAPPRPPAPPPPAKPEEKEKKGRGLPKLPGIGGRKDDAGAKASTAPAKPEEKEKKGRGLPKLPGIGGRKDDAGAKASTTPAKPEEKEKKRNGALLRLPFGGKRKKEEAAGKPTPPAGAPGGAMSPLGETKTGGVPTIPSGGGKPAPKPPVERKSPLEAIRSSVKNFRLFGGAAAKKTAKPAPKSKGGKPVEVKPISLSLDKRLEIVGIMMALGAVVIILSSLSPTKGALTEGVNRFLAQTFGWGAIGIPLAMLPIGIWLIMLRAGDDTPVIDTTRVIGVVLLYLCLLTLFQFIHAADYKVGAGQDYLTVVREIFLPISAELGRGGGRVGGFIYYQLISNLTEIGGFLMLLMTMLVAIMLATNLSLSQIALILIGVWRGFNDARRRWAVRRAAKQAELAEKRRQALAAKQPPELLAAPAPAPPPTPMVKIPIQSSLPPPPSVSAPAPSAPVPAPPMETERSIAITAGGRRVTASLVTGTVNEPEAVKPTDEIKAVGDAPAALPNPPAALPIMAAASAPAQPEKTETDEKDAKKPSLFGGIVGALPTGRGAKPDDAPAAKVEPKPEEKGRGLGGFKLPFGKDKPDAPDAAKAEDAKPTPAPKPTPPAVPAVSVPGYVSPFRASSSAPKPPAPAPAPSAPPAAPAPAPVSEPALKRETAPLTPEEKPAAPAPLSAAPRPTPFQSKPLDEPKPTAPAPSAPPAAPAPAAPRPTPFQSKPLDEPKPTAPAPVSEPALKRETALLTPEEKPAVPAPAPAAPRPTPFQSKPLDEPKPTAPAPAAKAPAVLPANGISTLNSGAVGESAAPTDEAQTRAPAPAAVSRPPTPPAVAPPKQTPPLDGDEDDLEDNDELDLKNLRPAQPKGIGPLPREKQPPARVMPYRAPAAPPIKAPDAPKPAAPAESKADEKPALLSSGIAASALVKPPSPNNNNEEKPAAKAADKLAEPSADAVQPFAAPPARRVPPWEDAPKDAPKPADVKTDAPPAPVSAAPKDAPKPADVKADAPPAPVSAPVQATPPAPAAPPAPERQSTRQRREYRLPDYVSLLQSGTDNELNHEKLIERAKIIEDTLSSFGAPGRVVEVRTGPVITQFGVEPDYLVMRSGKKSRVKVSAIAALEKDLQLALGAKSIRIEAPVPGKGYVGIEVPNETPTIVRLRDVLESPEYMRIKSPLAIALGQSVDGTPVAAALDSMPHLLIAGTTGSGKSVCVNAIIGSLLLRNTPDRLKFIMIDPKRVELTGYNGIPHLIAPVVVEHERAVGVLKWLTREMDDRYRRFANAGARNLDDYNRHLPAGEEPLPYIVVIVDELADLMMLSPDETERAVTRIAALARATGIHLVIATQRPSVDVVTGLIKANFPARIAFAVASSTDSRVILDQPGADRLLGRGDMLYMSADSPAPVRLQGVFVSDQEIGNITRFWRSQVDDLDLAARPALSTFALDESISPSESRKPKASAAPIIAPWQRDQVKRRSDDDDDDEAPDEDLDSGADADEDELYEQAVEMVRRLNKASVSLLQRRLRIGYTRAARLIDIMEERGVVGPPVEGSKPRDVLPPKL